MIIKIPFKTPSANHLYFHWRGVKRLTQEARDLKKEIAETIFPPDIEKICKIRFLEKEELKDMPLRVRVEIHENWYYKNGKIKRADVANREKFLIDAVFDALEIDDRNIFECTLVKCQDLDNEFSEIKIEIIENGPQAKSI